MTNAKQAAAWNGWEGQLWASSPERYDGMLDDFNAPLFAAAGISEVHRVLDVGCGPGSTTREAARRAAYVVGIDISTPMVNRARADASGIDNIEFVRGDAQVHAFPKAGFDVAISRGGVMFFDDLVAGFTNIRRALRPGGRLAFISPTTPDPGGEYARATAALAEFLTRPSPAASGMMSMPTAEHIREVLDRAGFRDIAVEAVQATENLGVDAADAADFICSLAPVQFNLRDVDKSTVDILRDRVADGFRPHETPQGVQVRGTVWLTSATR
ncbi:methyltransferase domain-containing protein [Saccharopolyspora sp. NPDC000359]|uniref:class I SAM-dependent methyltransferase n=1 Tax=Saccharopolyspora sp. NPDC000359 TaxID=3154251 RepID=UPI0033255D1A